METAVYVLSCGALERSKNPCIESIVEACVSQNHKDILSVSGREKKLTASKLL